jgi:hypothetical protein
MLQYQKYRGNFKHWQSHVKTIGLQLIKCLQLTIFIKDLITIALERQCAKQNAKWLTQATSNQQLVTLKSKKIVTFFSLIIHDIVNYYLFVKEHCSLCHNIKVDDGHIISNFTKRIHFLKNNNNLFCQYGNWP